MTGEYGGQSLIVEASSLTHVNNRGSIFLSRIANYHEDRFLCFAWLAIAYFPPLRGNFNVDEINAKSVETVGYPFFGYWHFFNSAEAADLLDHNVSSLRTSF